MIMMIPGNFGWRVEDGKVCGDLDAAREALGLPAEMGATCVSIHDAAIAGSTRRVTELLDATPSLVHSRDEHGMTPLHMAACFAGDELIDLLLNRGAGPNAYDSDGWSPLHAAVDEGRREVADRLLKAGGRLDVFTAAGLGRSMEVAALLRADPSAVHAREGGSGGTALHWAASSGHVQVLELLLDQGADVNARAWPRAPEEGDDWNGYGTPLHLAARRGRAAAVAFLLRRGAEVDARTTTGHTPLGLAAARCDPEIVALLLANGARPDALTLHEAAALGFFERVKELLLAGPGAADARDKLGRSPLHEAAAHGQAKVAELLLAHGADINGCDNFRQTPLHHAATHGRHELFALMVQYGGDPEMEDDCGCSPRFSIEIHSHHLPPEGGSPCE